MKRKAPNTEQESELKGRNYWRSLDELAGTPGFKEHLNREFPEGASSLEGVNRRNFFKLMAASFALGGMGLAAGCRRPEEYILPYGKSVEGVIPGLPLYFATSMPLRKDAIPLLAETHQGRPTKLEGNPTYTPHGGGSSLLTQASVLDLYDPDRATTHLLGGNAATVGAIHDKLAQVGSRYSSNGGAGLAFLSEEFSSPTKTALVAQLKAKFPQAVWAEYEPLSESASAEASAATYGAGVKPIYRFAKAKRVLAIDSDFLGTESGSLYFSREFAKARRIRSKDDEMNRLYAVESVLTLTGGMADHRLRLASSHMLAFAGALAAKITGNNEFAALAQGLDIKAGWIDAAAADLAEHKGESLVVAGAHLPAAVHAIVYAINVSLGNVGQTVDFVQTPTNSAASISDLVSAIKAGSVKTLVILGGNPA
ncbi:MAG TPA: TAT-variant-translocated molybdopterin oxidoreductase [Opitutaceae bacterium]